MGRLSSSSARTFRQFAALGLATIALPAFTGFLQMDGPQSTMVVEGRMAQAQLDLFYVTLWVTTFIFVVVGGVLAYAQIKFRARPGDEDSAPPPQTHGHPLVEVGLIAASVFLLVIIAFPTVDKIIYMEDKPDPEHALVVKVTGYQWWFKFEYPELGIVTANEMVIPVGRPIHLELRTIDVIHSFWVPKLAGKVDLIPNRNNSMWLQAEKPNYYWAQCAEYCGDSHANMRFRVISLDETEFAAWAQKQKATARGVAPAIAANGEEIPQVKLVSATSATGADAGISHSASQIEYWRNLQAEPAAGSEDLALIARGRQLFSDSKCTQCHTIRVDQNLGPNAAPDLTHVGSRSTIAASILDNTPENLTRWLKEPNAVKPGNLMWRDGYKKLDIKLTDDDISALVAYLRSLK